jgi:1-deoxy-D-xylulose-5-phosphate reductoisomerase
MKKKIAILGSTGSIGKQTLKIIKKDKKNFDVVLLSTNKNTKLILEQAKEFNVKNIVIKNYESYLKFKKKIKYLKVHKNFDNLEQFIKKKLDYTMCAITGLEGLKPTLKIVKHTKTIAIANKESIICGWCLINKQLQKHKTKFIPVDSEHFSIWSVIKDLNPSVVENIIITASGGPFFNNKNNSLKITPKLASSHPNWKMGAKISVDSSTLMNKVFEIIEAKKIFNIELKKFKILIHPKSYVHAIVKLKNGLIKIVAHDTDMKIPITNSLYLNENKFIKTKKINVKILNNLRLTEVNKKQFPLIKLLKAVPKNNTLFETLLVSMNDELVSLFLNKKISYDQISKNLLSRINSKSFSKFKHKKLNNLAQIQKLNNFVRLKTKTLSVISSKK